MGRGSVSNCMQNRLRETSGHGKRLIVSIDLLTEEHSHDHSSQRLPAAAAPCNRHSAPTLARQQDHTRKVDKETGRVVDSLH